MKKDNKALDESIMTSVAKEVKKALNEMELPKSYISQEVIDKLNDICNKWNNKWKSEIGSGALTFLNGGSVANDDGASIYFRSVNGNGLFSGFAGYIWYNLKNGNEWLEYEEGKFKKIDNKRIEERFIPKLTEDLLKIKKYLESVESDMK